MKKIKKSNLIEKDKVDDIEFILQNKDLEEILDSISKEQEKEISIYKNTNPYRKIFGRTIYDKSYC